jgi:hypothetical protein
MLMIVSLATWMKVNDKFIDELYEISLKMVLKRYKKGQGS